MPRPTPRQTDPLPVVLRITGPARSVYVAGKLLKTNIVGCMVNGAALADLSSEKVYVKPHDLPATGRQGRGERGQGLHRLRRQDRRGRVVNRSGNLVGQAFIAGVLGGRGFSTIPRPI
jgi:conjugal transfer pilus assembly protein TraB